MEKGKLCLSGMCLAILLGGVACAGTSLEERLAPGQPPVIIAHRSAVINDVPENTLAWIAAAIDRGVDAIHINPQLTADGRYVLMHDHTLNRMTNVEQVFASGPPDGPSRAERGGKDYVRDYTAAQIARLRIVTAPGGAPQNVPTLEEALDLVGGRVPVLLGLKSYETDSLAAALAGRDPQTLFLFELCYPGTDQSRLRAAADATGLGVAGVLFRSRDYASDLEWLVKELGPNLRIVIVGSRRLSPEFLERARRLGLRVVLSGWAGPEDRALVEHGDTGPWEAALARGFGALTAQPDRLLSAVGR